MCRKIIRTHGVFVIWAAIFSGTVASAFADTCLNFWFSRNLIAERSAHCFGSPLGRDLFSNTNCNPNGAIVSPRDADTISKLRTAEKYWACKVDSNRKGQRTPEMSFLRRLEHQPVRDDTESSCIGFRGPNLLLYSAPKTGSAIVGTVLRGQNIGDEYLPENGWSLATVLDTGGKLVQMGWYNKNIWQGQCESYAG